MDGRGSAPSVASGLANRAAAGSGIPLIVDTTNFYGEPSWSFPGTNPNLHVIERFTRVDAKTVVYEFTVEDPTVWTRPWTGQIPMKPAEGPIYEYACHEGYYTLRSVM